MMPLAVDCNASRRKTTNTPRNAIKAPRVWAMVLKKYHCAVSLNGIGKMGGVPSVSAQIS
jgi:hypothetical protein